MEEIKQKRIEFAENYKKYLPFILSFILISLLFIILAITNRFMLFINDDKTNMDVLSGKYIDGPTNLLIYMSQILCYPLMLLYKAFPTVPFYGLLLIFTMWISCIIIGCCLIDTKDKTSFIRSVIIYISIVFVLMLFHIVNMQYTVVAIFPMLAVMTLLNKYPIQNKTYKVVLYYLLIFGLCLLSCAIRVNTFIMSLPFVCLTLLFNIVKDKKQILKAALVITIFLASFGIIKGVDKIIYNNSGADWQAYVEFNNVRTDLCDFYGFPTYDEAKELYDSLGMSKETVELITTNYYCLDLEEATVSNLQAILKYQKEHIDKLTRLKNAFYKVVYIYTFSGNLEYYSPYTSAVVLETGIVILMFIYSLIVTKNKKWQDYAFLTLLIVGMYAFSILITALMKFECRVATIINLLGIVSLALFIQSKEQREFKKAFITEFVICCLCVVGLNSLTMIQTVRFNNNSYNINQQKYQIEQAIQQDTDNLYFIDNNTLITYQTDNPLNSVNRISNLFFCSWNSHSPYVKQVYNNAGYENLSDVFKNANNLRIVIKNDQNGEFIAPYNKYIQNKYGRNCVLIEENFDMNDIFIYQVI